MNVCTFVCALTALLAGGVRLQADPHHPLPAVPLPTTVADEGVPVAGDQPGRIISGTRDFRYEYLPEKLVLPPEVKMKHGHGLCHDAEGSIYFTFEPERVDEHTRCLVRFAPDGTAPTLLGEDSTLARGVPHGLNIHAEKDGRLVLYHANNDAMVHKTTLDGRILWTQKWSPQMGNYRPTDATATPEGVRVLVADGYGSSMIHALQTSDGVYAGKSWGGLGSAHGELNCPHGITFDPRRQLLLTADRGNQRLEYFTLSGAYHSTIEAPEITAPCNADIRGEHVLVPDLDGTIVILDKDNKVVSVIEQAKLLGHRGFNHPHDAIWLPNGDLAVCTWNPGRLAYWRRLPWSPNSFPAKGVRAVGVGGRQPGREDR